MISSLVARIPAIRRAVESIQAYEEWERIEAERRECLEGVGRAGLD